MCDVCIQQPFVGITSSRVMLSRNMYNPVRFPKSSPPKRLVTTFNLFCHFTTFHLVCVILRDSHPPQSRRTSRSPDWTDKHQWNENHGLKMLRHDPSTHAPRRGCQENSNKHVPVYMVFHTSLHSCRLCTITPKSCTVKSNEKWVSCAVKPFTFPGNRLVQNRKSCQSPAACPAA